MAELVQRHMESMADEIEELRRTKLFNFEQTRWILKMRKDFEYKINGISKNLQDFRDYIQYERGLLKQIRIVRDKFKIAERKSAVEYKILARIGNLYEIALQRFSTDFALSLSYFKFCQQSKNENLAAIAIKNMLKNCSQKPEVWQVAAAWYANDQNDLNKALKVLNKGLTIHKDSRLLYTEAIKYELSVLQQNTGDDDPTVIKVSEKIKTYLEFISECIDDAEYLITILNLIEPCTKNAQNFIIEKLLDKYSDKDCVWHALAQREKRGLHFGDDNEEKSCLFHCFSKYEEGLNKVPDKEKSKLWSLYLDCLIDIQQETNDLSEADKTSLLKNCLEKASKGNFLNERYYITWLELASDEEALPILQKGTSSLPQSVELWKLHLRYATLLNKNSIVDEVFNQGVEVLKEKSLPLWFMCIRYYTLLGRINKIDSIYKEAIKKPQEIAKVLKPKYIEWLALTKTIGDAREMYNQLAPEKPYCKELHLVMSKLESLEINYDFVKWKKVHELACKQFGEDDVDVWINYILFYVHYNKTDNANDVIQSIYRDALNTLSPLLQSDFREKYTQVLYDVTIV